MVFSLFVFLPYLSGLFISNGPGDPTMCAPTIEYLKKALTMDRPIFGICLGNQVGFQAFVFRFFFCLCECFVRVFRRADLPI
jgi:CTP synthase (UTP-ammonia lyase)